MAEVDSRHRQTSIRLSSHPPPSLITSKYPFSCSSRGEPTEETVPNSGLLGGSGRSEGLCSCKSIGDNLERLTEEQVQGATLDQLTIWARQRNLNSTGTTEELQQRLIQFSELQGEPQPLRYGEFTRIKVRGARKAELQLWCSQYGLDDSGTVPELRDRLFDEMDTPYIKPSEYVAPPPAEKEIPKWGKVGLVVSFLFLITVVALVLAGQPTPEPTPEDTTASENAYFSTLANIFDDGADSLIRYSNIVGAWVPGVNDNTISRRLNIELTTMELVRNRCNRVAVPCSVDNGMHSNVRTALNNYVSAMEWTILGVETFDADILDQAVGFLGQGNLDLNRAQARLETLQPTVPNC